MMAAEHQQYSMTLQQLLEGLSEIDTSININVTGLAVDSRKVSAGDLFIAFSGTNQHGAEFIPAAVKAGAAAIVYEADYPLELPKLSVPIISVKNLKQKAGVIAHRFYQQPSERIDVIGITGTNGKTSTAWFLAQCLQTQNEAVGFIGTLGTGLYGNLQTANNTTPDVVSVHKLLAEFCDAGAKHAVMEVSSHALEQHRVSAVNYHSVIFTNLSHEHLDYHSSMQEYAAVKRRLFTDYASQFKIINIDDEYGQEIANAIKQPVYLCSLKKQSDTNENILSAEILESKNNFLQFELESPWGSCFISSNLIGDFNVSNLLSVICVLCLLDHSLQSVKDKIKLLSNVPGRMECFGGDEKNALIIVDYAHTPDALENVLKTLREHAQGWLITLFGCGGDRDQAKRTKMGEVAELYSDQIILTNDNPRNEDPEQIIKQIKQGISSTASVYVELDRAKAISYAMTLGKPGDVILIAGKGHEDYQIIGDQKIAFDDRVQVRHILESTGD